MRIDRDTGEILSWEDEEEYQEPVSLESFRFREDFLEHFQEETHHKVMWTNWAFEVLLESSLPKPDIERFRRLCDMILARNVIVEHRNDIAEHVGVQPKNANRLLNKFVEHGLMKIVRQDVGQRGIHHFEVNPTLVWKGYTQKGVDFEDHIAFGSHYRFSALHKRYVKEWCMPAKEHDHRLPRSDQEIIEKMGFKSMKQFDGYVRELRRKTGI